MSALSCACAWRTGWRLVEWSPSTIVEAGLLSPPTGARSPSGAWAEDRESDDRRPRWCADFEVGAGLVSARLYATAHGLYEAELNGSRVGDDALSPGWTVYRQRLRYYTYDVTDLLQPGANAIGAWLGDGGTAAVWAGAADSATSSATTCRSSASSS